MMIVAVETAWRSLRFGEDMVGEVVGTGVVVGFVGAVILGAGVVAGVVGTVAGVLGAVVVGTINMGEGVGAVVDVGTVVGAIISVVGLVADAMACKDTWEGKKQAYCT
jgi:hypothetical protein